MPRNSKRNSKPRPRRKPAKSARPRKPRPRRRRAGIPGRPPTGTADWAEEFLFHIRNGLHVRGACTEVRIHNSLPYQRRDSDEAFRLAWDKASAIGTKALEAEVVRRAYHGTLKPVFYEGIEVGQIREYSDTLAMFLLKARRPRKYRERGSYEIGGKDGGTIQNLNIKPPDITADEFRALPIEERVRRLKEVLHAMNR